MSTVPKQPAEQLAANFLGLYLTPPPKPVTDFEELVGAGDDVWADDAEFEAFQNWLRQTRREGQTGTPAP